MTSEIVLGIYEKLYNHFGSQDWWPADEPFEVMVGAILTQNTNWQNVEKALDNLKRAGLLSYEKLVSLPTELLAEYIRPAGYFNVKAGRLHNFLQMVREEYSDNLDLFLSEETESLRQALLSVKGIGPGTADLALQGGHQRGGLTTYECTGPG